MTPQAKNAGLRLRLYRLLNRIPAGDLAQKLDVSRAALYRYEKGGVNKLETVGQIATLLGRTFEEVLEPLSAEDADLLVVTLLPADVRPLLARESV